MALFLPFHAHALAVTPIDLDFFSGGIPVWDFGAVTVGQTAVLGVSFDVRYQSGRGLSVAPRRRVASSLNTWCSVLCERRGATTLRESI